MQTLADWLDYINRQHSAEIVMGLDRVRAVWQRMGSPLGVAKLDVALKPINIVVAGTNGKGSTSAMLDSILSAAGYRTGFYSSPHLLRFNERIKIAQEEVSDAALIAAFEAVEDARCESPAIALTYFEYATLCAFWCFAREGVEVAILEVGMGGRMDAVNIIDADVSIVVSVDLDHQSYLGDTVEKIAVEKAHVYRAGRPAIFADATPPQSLVAHCETIGAHLHVLGRDYRYTRMEAQWQWTGTIMGQVTSRHALPVPALRGSYQLKNASAAIAALAALADRLPISQNELKRGLLEVQWPGRMQVLPGRPAVVLDVAHNPHAAHALDEALGGMGFYENTHAVFSMLRDKDIDAVIRIIAHRIDHWHIAGLAGPRGTTVEELAQKLDEAGLAGRYTRYISIAAAYDAARGKAEQNDRILGFGSFHTVAELLHALGR
jgi:dihydrofolate synthase / folylpolyglutamate synthase